MKLLATIGTLCALLTAGPAYPFGGDGHMAVGNLADKLIEGTVAAGKVKAILGSGEKLREAAVWPDCARSVAHKSDNSFKYTIDPEFHSKDCVIFETPEGQKELEDYVARNWDNCEYSDKKQNCHKAFHVADIPLQLGRYSATSVGASTADNVHAINACIAFLKNGTRTEPFRFSEGKQGQREALRLLVHLLGDVHQPLHVGAVYLTANGRATNPNKMTNPDPEALKKAIKAAETLGGNLLFIGGTDKDNLHKHWDAIATALSKEDLTGEAAAVPANDGAIETWAEAWATESIQQARVAYKGLSFDKYQAVGKSHGWPVLFKDRVAYEKTQREILREQVTRGGARLAEVLQTIWPD